MAASLITPLAILVISLVVNAQLKEAETARAEQEAIREFSTAVYGRRTRAELLASSLRRHADSPNEVSFDELVERKRLYDDAYFQWNATSHANLVLIRRVVQGEVYSNVESFVEADLVGTILAPLDSCLTRA